MLYAAYGSNLNADDLAAWARSEGLPMPLDDSVGAGLIGDRAPAFTVESARRGGGVLDILPVPGALTPCALYEVDEAALALLDRKEMVPETYRRTRVTVLFPDGGATEAVAYEVRPERRRRDVVASAPYVEIVREGLHSQALPTGWLDGAAAGDRFCVWKPRFFVYGTLMRGEARFAALRQFGILHVRTGRTLGILLSLGAYPGLVAGPGAERVAEEARESDDGEARGVEGELVVLERPAEAIPVLDEIEGFPGFTEGDRDRRGSLFVRRLVSVSFLRGKPESAWAWLWAGDIDLHGRIADGSWRSARGVREAFLDRLAAAYEPHLKARDDESVRFLRSTMLGDLPEALRSGLVDEDGLVRLTTFDRAAIDDEGD
ncbi:MAG TPA: gamma-glutamylcyclotransferase [Phycisphaerales bacterium]|nr:gamma-glutamylcyclotransferase [Phycisphaerales bacterium]HMP37247.1 gamma-glutamylcyclotransferase [Phycisphaerales bacterium]